MQSERTHINRNGCFVAFCLRYPPGPQNRGLQPISPLNMDQSIFAYVESHHSRSKCYRLSLFSLTVFQNHPLLCQAPPGRCHYVASYLQLLLNSLGTPLPCGTRLTL